MLSRTIMIARPRSYSVDIVPPSSTPPLRTGMSFLRYAVEVFLAQALQVVSDPGNVLGQHVGNGIWTSAQELATFLCSRESLMRNQVVLELGAGLGLVGQAIAMRGADVVVSDTQEMMQLLRMNVEANKAALQASPGSISQCVLLWGTSLSGHACGPHNLHPDYIVGSDITYNEDCYLPLLQTIAAYAYRNPHLKIILAMPDRQETVSFLETAAAHGLIHRLLHHIQKPDLLTPVSIYQFIFRPALSPEILQLVSGEDSSAAHSLAGGSKGLEAVSESTHSLPAERLATSVATGPMPSCVTIPTEADNSPSLPSGTLSCSQDPEPPKQLSMSTSRKADVHCCPAPASTVRQHSSTKGQPEVPTTLLVLDFDWSMIEDNSDTFVMRELGAWEAFQRLRAEKLPWTELMHRAMAAAHEEHGASAADVQAACAKVPMHPHMQEVLKEASANSAVHMVILSDANTVFIEHVLEAQGLQGCFTSVVTNPAEYRNGALRVGPYHTAPHRCASCPPNLCKGLVLEDLLLQHNYQQVVYLGDGKGDYCPCTRLGPTDCILARQRYPDGSGCALSKLLADQGAAIKDTLQCLSSEGAPQKAAPMEQNLQCQLPVAPVDHHTSAAVKRREPETGAVQQQDAVETGGAAKRHKGHGIELTWGKGFCSSSQATQARISSEKPKAAEIDSDKCQAKVDHSTNQSAPCHDALPPHCPS